MSLLGHLWTIAPRVRHGFRPIVLPESRAFRTVFQVEAVGEIPVTGRLREVPGSGELLVVVHGLGGCTDSHYMLRAALTAEAAGISCLRVNLRGCDRGGDDFYHAGLTEDLHAALASEELRNYRRIYFLGYSLGGHVALRLGTEDVDPRVAAVAAVCSPLDLALSQQEIDAPSLWVYRRYLLKNLVTIYSAVASRRPVPLPVEEAARIRTLREWDDRVVAPRHGFADARDYYARASVAPRLADLRVPGLLVASELDPMVPAHAVRAALGNPAPRLEVRWLTGGGHVAFPRSLEVDRQVIDWLRTSRS